MITIKNKFYIGFVSLLLFGWISSCTQTDNKNNYSPPSSDQITESVSTHFETSSFVDASNINVRTAERVVTLEGEAETLMEKSTAEKLAKEMEGVRSVVNNLTVVNDRPDDEILNDVQAVLSTNPVTEPLEITAQINNGLVTLEGVADSWEQRRLTAKAIKSVEDVTEIQNNIIVRHETIPTDKEITDIIIQALKWDERIDGERITVEVENQEVTLSGSVYSARQKTIAKQKAHVQGVEKVNTDDLEVKPAIRKTLLENNQKTEDFSDKAIEKAVNDALTYDPRVLAFEITTEVTDGVVTLTGKVDNLRAKRAAEEDAENTEGVKEVKNNIKVQNKVIVRPDISFEDKALQERAQNTLNRSTLVEISDIDINVKNGHAELTGTVDSEFEKQKATELLESVIGILSIENNLTIEE